MLSVLKKLKDPILIFEIVKITANLLFLLHHFTLSLLIRVYIYNWM